MEENKVISTENSTESQPSSSGPNEGIIKFDSKSKPLTRREIAKINKLYVTKEYPRASCGHIFVLEHEPKNNCETCWFTFFDTYGQLTQEVEKVFQEHGADFIIGLRGVKFYKYWRKFMSTVAQFINENTKKVEQDEEKLIQSNSTDAS